MSGQDGSGGPRPEIDDETLDLYVLGALDPDESARVAAAVASDADLAARAAQTEEVLAMLGSSTLATPSPSMRASVLATLDDVPQERPEPVARVDRVDPSDELAARRERRAASADQPTRRSTLRYAVAAAAVVVAGAGGYAAWSAAKGEPQDAVAAARERIEAASDAQVVPASDASGPWARSELRWSASVGEAVITAPEPLPSSGSGVYQLWRIADAQAAPSPVVDFDTADGSDGSGGVVVPGGAAQSAVIAVSRESGPGATSPTTPLVATYPLST